MGEKNKSFRSIVKLVWGRQKGAALPEFALAGTLFFMIILVFFQAGIIFHRYQLLSHVVNSVTRELAVNVAGNTNKGDLQNAAEEKGEALLALYRVGSGQFTASVKGNSAPCILELSVTSQFNLLNTDFFPGFNISVASDTYIEDKAFNCAS